VRSGGTSRAIVLGAALCALAMLCTVSRADIESTPLGEPEPNALIESRPIGDAAGAPTDPFAFSHYLETLLALGFVLGLAVAGSVLFKKFAKGRGGLAGAMGPGGPSPSGVLEILGRYPIGAGQSLVLLRFDTRVLLLHQVGGRKSPSMRTISEVTSADEVASIMMKTRDAQSDAAESSFRETIRKMERGFGEPKPARNPPVGQPIERAEDRDIAQQQIDLLVGHDSGGLGSDGILDIAAIRGKLRGWVGAGS
jgi:flagellar biogenesis protein FliO